MDTLILIAAGLALAVGLAGTIVTRLPGIPLIWTAVVVWAAIEQTSTAWIVAAIASGVALLLYLIQYRLAGGKLAELAESWSSVSIGIIAAGGGLVATRGPLGFIFGLVGGTYLAERRRLARRLARQAAGRAIARRATAGRTTAGRATTTHDAAGGKPGAAPSARAPLPGRWFTTRPANLVELAAGVVIIAVWLLSVAG